MRNPYKSTLLNIVYSRRWGALRLPPPIPSSCNSENRHFDYFSGLPWRYTPLLLIGSARLILAGRKGFVVYSKGVTGTSSLLFGHLGKALPRTVESALIPAGLNCALNSYYTLFMLRAIPSKRFSFLTCTQRAATMSKSLAHPLRSLGWQQTTQHKHVYNTH